jgi:hypothetical protein
MWISSIGKESILINYSDPPPPPIVVNMSTEALHHFDTIARELNSHGITLHWAAVQMPGTRYITQGWHKTNTSIASVHKVYNNLHLIFPPNTTDAYIHIDLSVNHYISFRLHYY